MATTLDEAPHLLQPEAAVAFMKGMYEKSAQFRLLVDTFTDRGFQFYFERAKVFLYAGQVDRPEDEPCGEPGARTPFGVSANLFGILPSFVEARPCDDQHQAIGIAVHDAGAAVATRVTVEHGPFHVAEFTLIEPQADGGLREVTVKTSELARHTVDEIAEKLGREKVSVDDLPPDSAPLSDAQRKQVIADSLEQILADPFASPLYGPAGPRSLLAQLPLVQKFAVANLHRFTDSAQRFSLCLATSSTCSNGCTTSSIIINSSTSKA